MFGKKKEKETPHFAKTFIAQGAFTTYHNTYYQKNPILRTVIDYVSTAFSGIPLTGDYKGHKLYGSETNFLRHSCTLLLLDGNVFFATTLTKIIVPIPKRYVIYNDSSQQYQLSSFDKPIRQLGVPANTKIARWAISPFENPYSTSKVETIRPVLDRLEANVTTTTALLNNGHPSGILSLKDPLHAAITPEVREEMEKFFKQTYSKEGYSAIHVSSLPYEFIPLTVDWKTLELNQIYLNDVRLVCAAFGISPILVLDTERSTYNNIAEARTRFYSDTLLPLAWSLVEVLNQNFGTNLSINLSEITSLSEEKFKNVSTVIELLKSNVITPEEARRMIGL